jgi:O-succinylbenzoic acid--CoA ligase
MASDWTKHTNGVNYNGKWLDRKTIDSFTLQHMPAWEQSIFFFMKEWISDMPFIEVKTSGSTGKPKTIRLMKSTMVASAEFTCRFLNLKAGNSALLCLPAQFIGGKMMIVRSFVQGLSLYAIKPGTDFIIDVPFDFTAMTPHQFESLLKINPAFDNNIKKIILGGSAPSPSLIKKIKTLKSNCYLTYGMTETSSHIAMKKLGNATDSLFKTTDESIQLLIEANGCLSIKAPYLGGERIYTNDVVEIFDQRHFQWLGRIDNVINSGGIKLHPEIIEQKLTGLFDFRFFIFGCKHERFGERPCLIIENNKAISVQKIWDVLKNKLTKIELPDSIFLISKMVETENGKINRPKSIAESKKIN